MLATPGFDRLAAGAEDESEWSWMRPSASAGGLGGRGDHRYQRRTRSATSSDVRSSRPLAQGNADAPPPRFQ
jgi:hypothetical protein